MARTSKFTKEELIDAAMGLVRGGGFANLTPNTLTKAIGVTPATIFSHFPTMGDLNKEIRIRIKSLYDSYIAEGLTMTPPLKGLSMQLIRFAKDYPQYFKILLFERQDFVNFKSVLKSVAHLDEVTPLIEKTFDVNEEQAVWIYESLTLVTIGVTSLIVSGNNFFDEKLLADNMSRMARAIIKEAKRGGDDLTKVMPGKDVVMNGELKEYIGE